MGDTTGPATGPLRGMCNVSYWAADHAAATAWYTTLLGMEPYFQMPGYAEWRVGDYGHELGMIDAAYSPTPLADAPGGAVLNWHVDDVRRTLDRLLGMGATMREEIRDRGEGFVTAAVVDPFGNVLGVMTNPHYVQVLADATPDGEKARAGEPAA
jgi:catechol 2,3-dioxygenase-like lactoylglutathione lyase family enzyme